MRDLTGSQSRQAIDCEQLFSTWRESDARLRDHYSGSMIWKTVSGHRYLYRKYGADWKSLGPESDATRLTYDSFTQGRTAAKARKASLDIEIKAMAPVNRAMKLGRVPWTTARILRRLDRLGVLGHGIQVAGTHALYAYERMGGVHFGSDVVATQDVDLLYDVRGGLDLVGSGLAESGLLGELRRLDASFELTGQGSYRAANASGFMVDLITPAQKAVAPENFRRRLGDAPQDITAAEIDGLAWIESCPSVSQVAIDERGFPLLIVAPDPRAFVCHKRWVATRDDRDPLKKRRDAAQADAVAAMLRRRLPFLTFDDPALSALPAEMRRAAQRTRDSEAGIAEDGDEWA